MTSFYTTEELPSLGLKSYGEKVLISRKCSIYGAHNITIGSNVRIDDFCILSGKINLGSHIHISAYCAIYGSMGVTMEDYSGLSPYSTIFSAMDDFSGDFLIGPIHSEKYTNVQGGLVTIKKFVQIGVKSIIFPNLTIAEGTIVGANSFVKKSLNSWSVYAGSPVRFIKERKKGLLDLLAIE